jgi:glycosyltransferase involved in cell wall biosynthesis
MRILLLAPQPFFEVRGTPLAVLAMVRALTALGHRVDLLTYPQGEPVDVPGVLHKRSLRLPVGRVRAGPSLAKLALDVPFLVQAVWLMARGGYDVVHAVEEAAHLASPFARLLRVPMVADVDSSIPDQLRYSGFARRGPLLWAARAFERHALRSSAAVITVCGSLTDGVRRTAPTAHVFQVEDPPLIDPDQPPDPGALEAERRVLGLGPEPVVFYSGNFEPYQGVELLVEAAARLPDLRFLFMGGEAREIEALQARAGALGVADRCLFLGKRRPAELPTFLGLAEVLVSPRLRGENTPFKIYTYLASGKPIVATRIPTHTQLLDERLAFLTPPTPEGLAGGIREAVLQRDDAVARARRGQDLVRREFSPARYAEKVKTAYAQVEAAIVGHRP